MPIYAVTNLVDIGLRQTSEHSVSEPVANGLFGVGTVAYLALGVLTALYLFTEHAPWMGFLGPHSKEILVAVSVGGPALDIVIKWLRTRALRPSHTDKVLAKIRTLVAPLEGMKRELVEMKTKQEAMAADLSRVAAAVECPEQATLADLRTQLAEMQARGARMEEDLTAVRKGTVGAAPLGSLKVPSLTLRPNSRKSQVPEGWIDFQGADPLPDGLARPLLDVLGGTAWSTKEGIRLSPDNPFANFKPGENPFGASANPFDPNAKDDSVADEASAAPNDGEAVADEAGAAPNGEATAAQPEA